jgi:hypothetical protein
MLPEIDGLSKDTVVTSWMAKYDALMKGIPMISIVYGSPAAGSGNKRAASTGGLGRRPAGIRTIFANWLYQLPTLPPSPLLSS